MNFTGILNGRHADPYYAGIPGTEDSLPPAATNLLAGRQMSTTTAEIATQTRADLEATFNPPFDVIDIDDLVCELPTWTTAITTRTTATEDETATTTMLPGPSGEEESTGSATSQTTGLTGTSVTSSTTTSKFEFSMITATTFPSPTFTLVFSTWPSWYTTVETPTPEPSTTAEPTTSTSTTSSEEPTTTSEKPAPEVTGTVRYIFTSAFMFDLEEDTIRMMTLVYKRGRSFDGSDETPDEEFVALFDTGHLPMTFDENRRFYMENEGDEDLRKDLPGGTIAVILQPDYPDYKVFYLWLNQLWDINDSEHCDRYRHIDPDYKYVVSFNTHGGDDGGPDGVG